MDVMPPMRHTKALKWTWYERWYFRVHGYNCQSVVDKRMAALRLDEAESREWIRERLGR